MGLSLIFSIAYEYLFSFSKYFYKSMARIQPSFHHFHLFRPQHDTNFLLTSKDEPKHPGGSFPSNPNLLTGYFIYSSIWSTIFLPQEQFKTESTNISVHTTRYPRFCPYFWKIYLIQLKIFMLIINQHNTYFFCVKFYEKSEHIAKSNLYCTYLSTYTHI